MDTLIRVQRVLVLDGFTVQVTFTDNTVRTIDLDRYLTPGPYYDALRADPALFRAVFVDGGALVWPNEADIDPDVLYLGLPPNASEAEWRAAKALHQTQVTP